MTDAKVKRRWFKFSLRRLLLATAFVAAIFAVGAWYWRIERRFADAQYQYDAAVAKFDAGLSTDMDVCAESFVLYLAERERWFRGSAALKSHVDRLKSVEERLESRIPVTLYSDAGISAKQTLRDIRALRERFEKGDF